MEYFAFQELFEKIFVFYTLLKYFVFLYFRYLTDLVRKENSICQSSEILFYRTVSGSNQNSILDLTFFIWEALGTLLTWDTHLASTPACSWDGHTACLAQVGNHQAMKQEKKTKTAPQAHVRTLWVRPVRPAGGRAAGWAGQGI